MNLSPSEKLKIFRDLEAKGYKGSRSSFLRNVQKNGGPVGPAEPVGPVAEEKPFEEGTQYVPIDASRESYIDEEGFERSEYKIGVNIGGKEWVIPTVWDGEQHTEDEAYERFLKTGLHMGGPYDSIEEGERSAKIRTNMYNQHPAYVKHELGGTIPKLATGGLIKTKSPQRIVGKGYQDRKHHTGFMSGDLNQYTANVPNFASGGEKPHDPPWPTDPSQYTYTKAYNFNYSQGLTSDHNAEYLVPDHLWPTKGESTEARNKRNQFVSEDRKRWNKIQTEKTENFVQRSEFNDFNKLYDTRAKEIWKKVNSASYGDKNRTKKEILEAFQKEMQNNEELTEVYNTAYSKAVQNVYQEGQDLSLNELSVGMADQYETNKELLSRGDVPFSETTQIGDVGYNYQAPQIEYNQAQEYSNLAGGPNKSLHTGIDQDILDNSNIGSKTQWDYYKDILPSKAYNFIRTNTENNVQNQAENVQTERDVIGEINRNKGVQDYQNPDYQKIGWDALLHPGDYLGIGMNPSFRNASAKDIYHAHNIGQSTTANPIWNMLPYAGMFGKTAIPRLLGAPAEFDWYRHMIPSALNTAGYWLTPEFTHDDLGIYEPGAMDYLNLGFTGMLGNRLYKGVNKFLKKIKAHKSGEELSFNPLHSKVIDKDIPQQKVDYWVKQNPNATGDEIAQKYMEFQNELSTLGQILPSSAQKYTFEMPTKGGKPITISGKNPATLGDIKGRPFQVPIEKVDFGDQIIGTGTTFGKPYNIRKSEIDLEIPSWKTGTGTGTGTGAGAGAGTGKGMGYDQYVSTLKGTKGKPKSEVNYEQAATVLGGAGIGAYAGYDYLMNDDSETLAAFFALPFFKKGPKIFRKLKNAVKKGDNRSMLQIMQDAQLTDKQIQAVSKEAEASNIFKRPEPKIVVQGGKEFVETINPFNNEKVLVPRSDYIHQEGGAGVQKITDKAKKVTDYLGEEPIIEPSPKYTTVPNPYGGGTVEVLTSDVEKQLGSTGKGKGIGKITNKARIEQKKILEDELYNIRNAPKVDPVEVEVTNPYTGETYLTDDLEEFTGSGGGVFGSSKYGEGKTKKEPPKKDYSKEEAKANKPPPQGPKFGEGMFNPYSLIGGGVGLYEYLNEDNEAATEAMLLGLMGGKFKGKFKGKGGKEVKGVTPKSQKTDKNAFKSIVKGKRNAAFVSSTELINKYGSLNEAAKQGLPFIHFSPKTYTARGIGGEGVDPYGIVHANTPEGKNVGTALLNDIEKRGGFWNVTTPEKDISTARLANYDEKSIEQFIKKHHPDFDYNTYNANNPRNQFISDAEQGLGLDQYYTSTPTVETFDSGVESFDHFIINPVDESLQNVFDGGLNQVTDKNASTIINNLKNEEKILTDNAVNWAVKNKGKHYTDWNTKLGKVDGLTEQELKALKLMKPDGTLSEESLKKILGKDVYEENKIGGIESNILQEAKDKATQMYINTEMLKLGYDTNASGAKTMPNRRPSYKNRQGSVGSGKNDPSNMALLNVNLAQFDMDLQNFLKTKLGTKVNPKNETELKELLSSNRGLRQNLIYNQIIKDQIKNPIGKHQFFNIPRHQLDKVGKYGLKFSNEGGGVHGSTVQSIDQSGPMKTDSHAQGIHDAYGAYNPEAGYNIRIKNTPFKPSNNSKDFTRNLTANDMEVFNTKTEQWEKLSESPLFGAGEIGLQTSSKQVPQTDITFKDILLGQGQKKVNITKNEIKQLNDNIKNIEKNAIEETKTIRSLMSETEAKIYGDVDPGYIETVKLNPDFVSYLTSRGMLTRFDKGTYKKAQGTYDPEKFSTGSNQEKLAAAEANVNNLKLFINDKELIRQFLGIGDQGQVGFVHSVRGVGDIAYIQEHGKTSGAFPRELPHLKGQPLETIARAALEGTGGGVVGRGNYSSNSGFDLGIGGAGTVMGSFGSNIGDFHGSLELMFPEVEAMLVDPNVSGKEILTFINQQLPSADAKIMPVHYDAMVKSIKESIPVKEANKLIKELDDFITDYDPFEPQDLTAGIGGTTDFQSNSGTYRTLDEKFRNHLGGSMTGVVGHYGGYDAATQIEQVAERVIFPSAAHRIKLNEVLRVEKTSGRVPAAGIGPRNAFGVNEDLFSFTTGTLLMESLKPVLAKEKDYLKHAEEWKKLSTKQRQIKNESEQLINAPTHVKKALEERMRIHNADVAKFKKELYNILGKAGVLTGTGIGVGIGISELQDDDTSKAGMKKEEINILMKEMNINRKKATEIYNERVLSE